jgi:alkylation response protein AidB-like acyl-CoA dehydrogenase
MVPSPEDQLGVYYTPERAALVETARRFAMDEVLPIANQLDSQQADIPMTLRKTMAEIGFFGITIPVEFGGLGLGALEYILITEELSRAWMSVASLIARGNGLVHGFTPEMRERYLPKMARGEFLGAMAMSEADAGSDLAGISCRAYREGDDWVITGTKMWCTFADGADFLIVAARTSPSTPPKRHQGISLFLIEKERGTFPDGVSGTPIRKIGYHGWRTWELAFQDCRIPAGNLLGAEGRGFYELTGGLELARVHTAARALGLARGALEDSILYAEQRQQFERPIGSFQAIRFKIAEMATSVEAARQLTYFVAHQIDSGRRCDKESSMAKLFASEIAERVTSEGLQVHGGAGYTTDYPAERYWRDARLTRIFEGTSEIQMRVISDRLLAVADNG